MDLRVLHNVTIHFQHPKSLGGFNVEQFVMNI